MSGAARTWRNLAIGVAFALAMAGCVVGVDTNGDEQSSDVETLAFEEGAPRDLGDEEPVGEEESVPTTTPGIAPEGQVRRAPPYASGLLDERPAEFDPDCDPAASIETLPAQPVLGRPFAVRVEATSRNGFDFLWIFNDEWPAPDDLRRSFHAEFGPDAHHVWAEWSITLHEPGTYVLGAQGRDVLYGTQPLEPGEVGNGLGNQVSEGCGVPYLEIVID